jgi:hypothetical protein
MFGPLRDAAVDHLAEPSGCRVYCKEFAFCGRPRGLMDAGFGARAGIEPTRAPEARAPLAKPTAPVALQQSRILWATLDARLQSASHQSIAAARRRNPVLFRPRQNSFGDGFSIGGLPACQVYSRTKMRPPSNWVSSGFYAWLWSKPSGSGLDGFRGRLNRRLWRRLKT